MSDQLADSQGRAIRYLRVSITDRCNLRCRYCVPSDSFIPFPHHQIISYEEIARLSSLLASRGVSNIRITGGEPLVRKDLESLLHYLSSIPGVDDISLTTNGYLLEEKARSLREAGLNRVNVSLDTLRDDRFSWLTNPNGDGGSGGVARVLAGIEEAGRTGLAPVKINIVLIRGFNDDELEMFAALTKNNRYEVRFIEFMPMSPEGFWGANKVVPAREVIDRLEAVYGSLERLRPGSGAGPAVRFRIPGFEGTLGFISPVSEHFCTHCNRLRITADGNLRTCLFSDNEINITGPMRGGASDQEILALIQGALNRKPEGHGMSTEGEARGCGRTMGHIGG